MNKNIGNMDRLIRIILGLALIIWGVITMNYLGAIGLILVATALAKRCPAYKVIGVKTNKDEEQ
ncbi:YgaP family membrane protein [Psychromonas sp. L1A2]|uniref:YgaP family membrane protein n=1 Tax=Psychromonas sp. L1A2 TaxID=2686356 RepID=UPI00135CEB2A|nr:DUF2892 domain-containing protein [Psychromonas sp. L1A2]